MKKNAFCTALALLVCTSFLCTSCKKEVSQAPGAAPDLPVINPDIGGGKILFYTTNGVFKGAANVGNLPDMVTFLPSGKGVIAANEGEPESDYSRDYQGSVSIVSINPQWANVVQEVSTLSFIGVDIPAGVRIKPGSLPFLDLEPEYIALSEDGKTAWVTLQENNAIAIVDVEGKKITAVKALGAKEFSRIDIDSKDGANVAPAPRNIFGLYQPDTIAAYRVNGEDYIVTANEGDDREYEGWEDYVKAIDLKKHAGAIFSAQLEKNILSAGGKKSLRVLKDMGRDKNGTYTSLYLAGTRSFSIWDSEGKQVYDSGTEFEDYLAYHYAEDFNTRVDDSDNLADIQELAAENIPFEMRENTAYFWEGIDARSHKKGCEPEALALAPIGDKIFAYIGLEKQGGFFVYDITHPRSPRMVEYNNDIHYQALPSYAGDLAPEGMATFVQDGKHYLAVANEMSSTVSLYALAATGKAKKLSSLKLGSFDGGAAEIISYDAQGKQLFVTNGETKTVDILDIRIPEAMKKAGSIDFSAHGNDLQSVAVKNGLVAIAVKRKE